MERNEEGMFEKWLTETEDKVAFWREDRRTQDSKSEGAASSEQANVGPNLRSPTFYEQNIEVWRQL